MSKIFAFGILLLITLNTLILAMDSYPLNAERDKALD